MSKLEVQPDFILADAVTIPKVSTPQKGIIKGDAKSISIGAASIVAKVTRDAMMEGMAEIYPHYDFASNKGYGSQKHLAGIAQYGICPIHRRTFVKNFLKEDAAPKETGNRGTPCRKGNEKWAMKSLPRITANQAEKSTSSPRKMVYWYLRR